MFFFAKFGTKVMPPLKTILGTDFHPIMVLHLCKEMSFAAQQVFPLKI